MAESTRIRMLAALLLVGLVLYGCCDYRCETTVYCVHAWTGETMSKTVSGCHASCPLWYEKSSQSTWCPDD